ncbi:MAG: phosphotransferase [Pseudomonadota bacterium]
MNSLSDTEFSADLLRFNPPEFGEDTLHFVLKDQYGISGQLKHLAGERDQNTLVITNDGSKYVLKIAGPDERKDTVDFQVQTLLHLERKAPDLYVPRQVKNRTGEQAGTITDDSGKTHWVRLVTYVEGDPMGDYDHLDLDAVNGIGSIAGRMCAALQGFLHPAATDFMPWDGLNGLIFSDELRNNHLPDSIKTIAEKHLQRLEMDTMSRLLALPHQVIHHDAHPGNVICVPGKPNQVKGVIDFGDLICRPVLMDVSVALASTLRHNLDILGTASAMLDGYKAHIYFTEDMMSLLYDALCVSQILTVQLLNYRAQHHASDPEKIRQEDFSGALENAKRFLEFDQNEFSDHVMRHADV